MTREEQITFCRKCTNRKFDANQGIICRLTDKPAEFEESCNDFIEDPFVKDKSYEPKVELPNHEMVKQLSASSREKFKDYQDFGSAVIGGTIVTLLGAGIWAFVTVATGYQIGYMAIGIGLLVGFGVRFFGGGVDQKFGILGGVLALLSCLLGNLFSQVAFAAQTENLSFLQALQFLDWAYVPQVYIETFSMMDVLFYGIAIAEGYRFAFRAISTEELEAIKTTDHEPIPDGYKLRKPVGIAALLLFAILLFKFNKGVNGEIVHTYESGSKMSKGEYIDGKENGPWEYWYESGQIQAKVNFKNGIQDGSWIMYYESGQKMSEGEYKDGQLTGLWVNYYADAIVSDSGRYDNGRENGSWAFYYINGNLMQTGGYRNGNQDGLWKVYFENGQIQSEGSMKEDTPIGLWKVWRENGQRVSEINYVNETPEIINSWDADNRQTVVNGFGTYYETNSSGTIINTGKVVNKKKDGLWTKFYGDGKKAEEGIFTNDTYTISSLWDITGEQIVVQGNGSYKRYTADNTSILEQGEVINGKKSGTWSTYYESGNLMESLTYEEGVMNGQRTLYSELGMKLAEGSMEENKQINEWVWYHQDGSVESKVNFIRGEKDGVQSFYDFYGKKIKEEIYEEGKLMDTKILVDQ